MRLERTSVGFEVDAPRELDHVIGGLHHYDVLPGIAGARPRLRITSSVRPEIVVLPDCLELRAPLDRISRATVQMMVDLTYHRLLDEAGVMILHASVVSDGTRTYVLWGSSGSGKTTTAVALHERHGFSVLSNGTAMLRLDPDGTPVFVGSAKNHVKLRRSSVRASGCSLGAPFSADPGPDYENKVEQSLAELADESVAPPLPVTALVMIRLVRDLPDAQTAPLQRGRAGVEVYEDAVRHLHGLTAVLPDTRGDRLTRLPVLRTAATHDARRTLISALIDRGWSLNGPLDSACGVLARGTWPDLPTTQPVR